MLWAHKAAQYLAAIPPQIGHLTVYLDDLSMLSSQKAALETAMGYTQVFLDFWKVELNAAKSRLLANEVAQQSELPNAVVRDLDNRQGLLGAPAGMEVEEAMLQKRVTQAQIRLDRLALLPVSQGALRKLVLCFVSSVPYGLEMVPYSVQMRSLDRKVKNLTWGRAQCSSSNAHVLRSLVFHPGLLLETRRICSCFRAVWLLANREWDRETFMELWTVNFVPRHQGLWAESLAILAGWGAQLQVDGGVEIPWRTVKLSINASLHEWMHMVRQCIRLDHLRQAQRQNAVTFDYDLDELDWEALKAYQGAACGMQTLLSNGVNTKARAALHFRDQVSPQCEHGCDSHDDPHHRLYHCEVTAGLRRFVGITAEMVVMVDGMKKCSRDCAIWEYPHLAREVVLPPNAAHGLWPTRQWLQQLQLLPEAHGQARLEGVFLYRRASAGDHPQCKRHAARLRLSDGLPQLDVAVGLWATTQKLEWELDALLVMALIHTFRQVPVRLRGITTPLKKLHQRLSAKDAAHAHLADFVLSAMGAGGMEVIWGAIDDPELQHACRVPVEAAGALSRSWKLSRLVQEMVEDTFDLYPEAKAISRQRGRPFRGGQEYSLPRDFRLFCPAGLTSILARSQGFACIMCLLGVLALGATIVYSGACWLEA